jgi:hypothetical protein
MIVVPEQENASPGAGGWAVREGAKSKTSNIRRSLINVVEFRLLDAGNMAKGNIVMAT